MTARLRFTILGCGSSGGVPRIGRDGPAWGACNPDDPRNRRSRCALLVERLAPSGRTAVLIDAGPDIRQQLIAAGCGKLDAVVFTHEHADHTHGIDDLRMVFFNRGDRLPAWMDARTEASLLARFGYLFETPEGSPYPPILTRHRIAGPIEIAGAGGPVTLAPFAVPHGEIEALGFRIDPVAYLPDVSAMTEAAWAAVADLDCWILDALRWRPHGSHAHVDLALEWIAAARPRRAILTNLHVDIDYAELDRLTPPHVAPATDGLVLDYPA